MRLKMDEKTGEIVQVDSRFNDDRGIGRTPSLVEEDSVSKLSEIKDRQELFDRLRAQEMSRAGKREFLKQQKIKEYKEKIRYNLEQIAKAKAAQIQKMAKSKSQDARNAIKIRAIQQGATDFESLGVSGSGTHRDGYKPFPTFPARDNPLWNRVNEDFGSKPEAPKPPTRPAQNFNHPMLSPFKKG